MTKPLLFARALVAGLLIGAIVVPTLPVQARPYSAPVHRPAPLVQSGDRVVPDGSSTSVDKDGNFRVSVPIDVAPGIDGAQPSLSLEYDSAESNGVSGVGWQLAGISAITRCPQIPAIDGVRGTITFTRSDRFCLDGARLINVRGEYGAPGSAYQTEIQTWQYVVASTQMCGSGPCSFTVTQRDGTVVTYGADANAREMAGSLPEVRRWLASSSRGTNGNTITFRYTDPQGNLNQDIARIDYGANPQAGVTQPNRSVRFTYDGQRPDPIVQYVGGISYSEPRLLRSVATYVNDTLVTDTRLAYRTSVTTGRSLLASVQRCGANGCARPSEIAWSGQKATFTPVALTFSEPQPDGSSVSPVDVNGDGRADLSLTTNAGATMHVVSAISNGEQRFVTCTAAQIAHQPGERFFSGDVSADGSADTVQVFDTNNRVGVQLYRNTGNGCELKAAPLQVFNLPSKPDYAWLADVKGNGRADLVLAYKAQNGLQVATLLSRGTSFDQPSVVTVPLDPAPVAMFFADVNGDGMLDLVQITRDRRGTALVTAALSTGSGFAQPVSTQTDASLVDAINAWPLDLNHDGLTDVVIASRAADHTLRLQPIFATGAGAFVAGDMESSSSPASDSRYLGPIDTSSTGAPAIVNVYAFGNAIRVDTFTVTEGRIGDPVDAVSSFSPNVASRIFPLDFVGSGAASLVQIYPDRGRAALSGMRSTVDSPDVITAFTNPIGGRVRVRYAPLSDPKVYTPGPRNAPGASDALDYAYRMTPDQGPYQRVGGGVRPVVAELSRENDPARNASAYRYDATYHYGDGTFTYDGRGWLGFKTMQSTDRDTGAIALETFNQAFPLTGLVARDEARCTPGVRACASGATQLSLTENSYEVATTAHDPSGNENVVDPRVSKIETTQYQGGAIDVRRSRTFAYDAYGNVTKVDAVGAFDAQGTRLGGPSVLTCGTYRNDVTPDGWMLGLPLTRKVTSAATCGAPEAFDAGSIHLERYTYDPRGNQLTDGIYDNTTSEWLTTGYAYDAFGNQTRIVQPGGGTTDVTFDATYHTYPAREQSPANAQGTRAVTNFGYDPRFGIEAARQGPNGFVSVACVDDFGFVNAEQGPVPQRPANVRASQNCVGSVTGDAETYRTARVVTLDTYARGEDEQRRYVQESETLDAWPTGNDPASFVWRREYFDGLERDYQQLSEDGNNGAGTIVCSNFDSTDQALRTSIPAFLNGQQCTSTSGSGFTWSSESYDAAGRPLELTQPLETNDPQPSITRFTYRPGLVTEITKAAGTSAQVRTIVGSGYYDDNLSVTSLTLPDQHDARTTFGYDPSGQFTSALEPRTTDNPDGITTTVTYDSVGRRTSVDDPDQNSNPDPNARALRMFYGSDGLLARTIDARDDTIAYTRDPRGRITSKTGTFANGTRDTTVAYTYDDPAVNGVDALTDVNVEGAHGRIYDQRFAFDAYGNTAESRFTYGDGASYERKTLYDPRSRAIETDEPDGSVVTHRFAYGQLATIGLGAVGLVRFSARTPLGLPGHIEYGGTAASDIQYLPVGLPSHERVTEAGGTKVMDSSLSWDRLFNVRAVVDELKAGGVDRSERFGYAENRLTQADAPGLYGSRTYGYDPSGLRVRDGDLVGHFHAHRLESLTRNGTVVVSAQYDFAGNMTRRSDQSGATTLTYDTDGRLIETADAKGAVETYAYDDSGRRIEKRHANGAVTRYPFDGVEIEATPGHTAMSTIYLADDKGTAYAAVTRGGDLATVATQGPPQIRYIHANQVGSTSVVLDGNGKLEARLAYEPYGAQSAGGTGATPLTKRFQSHELDASRRLYYFGARYYDPGLGNFISADSELGSDLFSQDALNRYEFALANPETLVDVTGHGIFDQIVGFIVGVVEIVAGIAVDILSEGALEPLGQGLVGAGINGAMYSLDSGEDFSWRSYGDEQAVGFVLGAVTAGVGEIATSTAEAAADVAGSAISDVAEDAAENVVADASGEAVESESEDALSSIVSEEERSGEVAEDETSSLDSESEDETCEVSSFAAGTPVWTSAGERPIQSLRTGDKVLSRNAIDGSITARTITQTLSHATKDQVEISFAGSAAPVVVTREHAFATNDGRWVPAAKLRVGDRIRREDGSSARIVAIRAAHLAQAKKMYNLAVAGTHSYFAGTLALWVHNPCNIRRSKGKKGGKKYDVILEMPESEYPESAKHIRDAQKNGYSSVLTISRKGTKLRRRAALRGIKTKKGYDRDEYPPAMFKEGGKSSVRLIKSWDNRASGSSFGGRLRAFSDGTRVWFKIVP